MRFERLLLHLQDCQTLPGDLPTPCNEPTPCHATSMVPGQDRSPSWNATHRRTRWTHHIPAPVDPTVWRYHQAHQNHYGKTRPYQVLSPYLPSITRMGYSLEAVTRWGSDAIKRYIQEAPLQLQHIANPKTPTSNKIPNPTSVIDPERSPSSPVLGLQSHDESLPCLSRARDLHCHACHAKHRGVTTAAGSHCADGTTALPSIGNSSTSQPPITAPSAPFWHPARRLTLILRTTCESHQHIPRTG